MQSVGKETYDFCRDQIDESWHSLDRVRWKETKSRSQRCLDSMNDSKFLFWMKLMRLGTVWLVFRRGKIGEKDRWLHRGRHSRYSQKNKDGIRLIGFLDCRSRRLLKSKWLVYTFLDSGPGAKLIASISTQRHIHVVSFYVLLLRYRSARVANRVSLNHDRLNSPDRRQAVRMKKSIWYDISLY